MPLMTYQTSTYREDLSPILHMIADRATPLLARCLQTALAATAVKHEWTEWALTGFSDQLAEALDDTETGVDVDGTATHVAGEVILIDNEYMLVTGVSSNTLTVTRGYGGSTAAAHSDNTRVDIVARPELEGADANTEDQDTSDRAYNYTQIIERVVKLSGTTQAIDIAGGDGSMDSQLAMQLGAAMKELERSALMGVRVGPGSASVRRSMGGIRSFVTGVDKSAAALTAAMIDAAVYDLLSAGATPSHIIASTRQKRAINGLKTAKVQMTQKERTYGDLVDYYESEAGPLEVIRSNDLPPGELMIVEMGRIRVVPLQKRAFGMEPLAKTGDADNVQLVGEYTCEVANPTAHTRFYNLATA